MTATHGLVDSFVHFSPPTKQQVLLFDTLVFPRFHLDDQFASADDFLLLDRLRDAGIVRSLTLTEDETTPSYGFDSRRDLWLRFERHREEDPLSTVRALREALAQSCGIDAVPVIRKKGDWSWAGTRPEPARSVDVAEIILSTFPTPSDDASWDAILEFRRDPESRQKLLALRRWMTSFVSGSRSPAEIRDEVEYLLGEYRRHLELHRMKWRLGTLESILTLGAEGLEGILRLAPTRLVSALFGIRHRRIALLEAERSAPGREIAYLLDAGNVLDPG